MIPSEIMSLSNTLIYNGQLSCGNEAIATARLQLTLWTCEGVQGVWVGRVVDPRQPVVFINTDSCEQARESRDGEKLCNVFEAGLVETITKTLIKVLLYVGG